MVVPAVSLIRRTYPNAFIAWAIEDRCAAVADTDKLLNLRSEAPWTAWKKSSNRARSLKEQVSYFLSLRKLKFDFGIDFQGHSKTALCLRIARPTRRIARRATDLLARCLNPIAPEPNARIHRVERHIEVLRTMGQFGDDATPILPALDTERATIQSKVGSKSKLATITVGAGTDLKTVPIEHWRMVAQSLQESGFQVAFLGGPGDSAPEIPNTIDLAGKTTLAESMAAVSESDIHLCGDTGMGHVAAAYGIPVVSVFGDQPPELFRPYTDKGIVLREGTEARNVSPQRIIEAVAELRSRYGI
jgi:ADP-heptose:LPS heptosyltransferase